MRWWLRLILGLLVVGAAIFLFNRRQARELAELRAQVAVLSAETHEQATARGPVEIRYVGGYPTPPAATSARQDAAASSAFDAGSPRPSAEEQMKDVHRRYEAKFARDKMDPEWAARAKQILSQKLPALLPEGSSLLSVECRASLCRIESAHRDHDSYMNFIKAVFLNPEGQPWNAATYSTPLNDDPKSGLMVSYIAREGQLSPD